MNVKVCKYRFHCCYIEKRFQMFSKFVKLSNCKQFQESLSAPRNNCSSESCKIKESQLATPPRIKYDGATGLNLALNFTALIGAVDLLLISWCFINSVRNFIKL